MIQSMIMRLLLALTAFSMIASPVAAQVDPAARGLAVQARTAAVQAQTLAIQAQTLATQAQTLAIGRDVRVFTAIGDSRIDAVYIDANQNALNMRSALVWARELSGSRFTIGSTQGKSGDRTDQMLPRMAAVLATRAGVLYIQAGVNDLAQNYPTATTSGATAAANIITMAEMARLAGMTVIIEAEVGANGLTAAQVSQMNDLNVRLSDYVEGTPGVYLNDARSAVMQPTASTTTVAFRAGYSGDGTHELSRGAYAHGGTLLPLINQIVPPRSVLVRSATELPGNGRWQLLANPIFATATGGTLSGTATGTAPSGWTVFGSANTTSTFGTQADPDGLGNNVTMSCQWAGAGDNCRVFQTAGSGNWMPGDIVQAVAQLQVTSASSCLAATRLELVTLGTLNGSPAGFNYMDGYHATTAGSFGSDQAYTVTLMTRPFTVPAYSAKSYMAAYIHVEGSCAGTVNVVVKQISIKRRLSAPSG